MPNRLANENSPYLLQHANNPVDWYPWGEEALVKARTENRPIFLSIGYAACHWCHVMEHESFEDPQTAGIMNEYFVNIKVDREERPDLDNIYMNAVVALTGQGGWPMSVFLTPSGQPFWGGTYFPSTRRYNMPSFKEILLNIARAWREQQDELLKAGQNITEHLQAGPAGLNLQGGQTLNPEALNQAAMSLAQSYDWKNGGWGRAPKFPQPMAIEFLLSKSTRGDRMALDIAVHALRSMATGGMYDLIGGGFARYSTDDNWLVPHFEKMLYDNAQLALAYLHAYRLTGEVHFRQVCEATLDFVVRELRHPQGGFYSSLDADSEGEEGKYYVWTLDQIRQVLPDPADADLLITAYGLNENGNFEGANVLQRQLSPADLATRFNLSEKQVETQLLALHARLLAERQNRVRPGTDDKVLVSWNALMLSAFAQAARYLERADYLLVARDNADFLLSALYADGRLLRSWRNGQARHSAYLEDYAALSLGLIDLYQSDPDPRWFSTAQTLVEQMVAHFSDPAGGFFDTADDHEALVTRPKDLEDNAIPSGNALAASALLQLSAYTGSGEWRSQAESMLGSLQSIGVRYPTSFGRWLAALDFAIGPVYEVAILGNPASEPLLALQHEIWSVYRPRLVAAISSYPPPVGSPPLLADRPLINDQPTAYVCQAFVCQRPVTGPADLRAQLE